MINLLHAMNTGGDDLITAITMAEKAGEIIRKKHAELIQIAQQSRNNNEGNQSISQNLKIEHKSRSDMRTEADLEADKIITEYIRKNYPKDLIVSEELNPDTPASEQKTWIVDPLDGTTAFRFQMDKRIVSVLITLRENFRTILGVTYFPLTDELFYAVEGKGAFKNDGFPIHVNPSIEDIKSGWIEMNRYGEVKYETAEFRKLEGIFRSEQGITSTTSNVPNSGAAVRIAEGITELSAVVHDNNPKSDPIKQGPWDIAAPQLILEEAGGVFWNLNGESIDPFKQELIIAAANAKIANNIINLLNKK